VKKKNQETLERLTNAKKTNAAASKVQKAFTSYAAPADVPRARELQVMIDKSRESVLLPIYGATLRAPPRRTATVTSSQRTRGSALHQRRGSSRSMACECLLGGVEGN
jgi:nucleosome binding factor SPN SPT16 subunit